MQKTDLNVSPYYDDFDNNDNFHRVLFRPGFAVQARELTTLQSILQNQVERHGSHMFKEGSIVIPGQLSYSNDFPTLQLASTFASEEIDPSQFFDSTNPVTITGATSGVKAYVTGFQAATATTQPLLIVQYLNSGSDNATESFSDSENISADISITHNTAYGAAIASATTHSTSAAQVGSSVKIEEGVYFIRGTFVRCTEQTLLLSSDLDLVKFPCPIAAHTSEVDSTSSLSSKGSIEKELSGPFSFLDKVKCFSIAHAPRETAELETKFPIV